MFIADTPAEAANLKLRSELMDQIAAIVAAQGMDTKTKRPRAAE